MVRTPHQPHYTLLALIVLNFAVYTWAFVFVFAGYIPNTCAFVFSKTPEEGTQGYRIWSGYSLKSFEHADKRICIPHGFEAVGAQSVSAVGALFEKGKTGIFIRTSEFTTETLTPEGSEYTVDIRIPVSASQSDIEKYRAIVAHAFTDIAGLYPSSVSETQTHTVLVTAGLAGNTRTLGTRVYPDPTEYVSMLVRTPDHARAEELFIHAIMHVYNREHTETALPAQLPLSAQDWQEFEATWAEIAFVSDNTARQRRIEYLYNIHTAVIEHDFSRITEEPFNDATAFAAIATGVAVAPSASYLEYQYGHYVLAPLTALAIEGLLTTHAPTTSMHELLAQLHAGAYDNFFEHLATILPPSDMELIYAWLAGTTHIPHPVLEQGLHKISASQ